MDVAEFGTGLTRQVALYQKKIGGWGGKSMGKESMGTFREQQSILAGAEGTV